MFVVDPFPSGKLSYEFGSVMWLLCLFAEFTVALSVPCMRMNMNTSMKIGFGTRDGRRCDQFHDSRWNNSSMIRNNLNFFSFPVSIPVNLSLKKMLFRPPPDISPLICSTKIYTRNNALSSSFRQFSSMRLITTQWRVEWKHLSSIEIWIFP